MAAESLSTVFSSSELNDQNIHSMGNERVWLELKMVSIGYFTRLALLSSQHLPNATLIKVIKWHVFSRVHGTCLVLFSKVFSLMAFFSRNDSSLDFIGI